MTPPRLNRGRANYPLLWDRQRQPKPAFTGAALPAAWPDGGMTGLRARGGFEVDVTWKNGALERTIVRSLLGQPVRLRRGNTVRSFDRTSSGATLTLLGEDLRQNPQR